MALMRETSPHIVISASGMCESGRILHHLRCKVHNPRNTILFVGYNAQHTLGRRLADLADNQDISGTPTDVPQIKILNKLYPVKAHIEKLGGFSAHADKNELLKLIKESNLSIKRIALVHGEESQSLSFSDTLSKMGYNVCVPRFGESIEVKQ